MSKENNLTDFLTDLADGIRAKKGTADPIPPQSFEDEIRNLRQLPQLHAPTISLDGNIITVTDSTDNGAFTESFGIYLGEQLISTLSGTTQFTASEAGTYTATAQAEKFKESDKSNSVTIS